MRRLEDKAIVVAGAGGIGSELARRYAEEGAGIVLGDLDLAGAERVVADIVAAGGRAVAIELDGGNEDAMAQAVALCCDRYGGVDGVHLNFATFIDGGNDVGVLELPLEDFDETMRVNLRGFYLGTRAALPALRARGGGAILYTSSVAAFKGEPTRVAYAIAKAGGLALMRHVAARYGPEGIRANAVAPGAIIHGKWERELPQETKDWLLSQSVIKSRLGRPADIAAISALLMSDEGSYITGQVMTVDGGVSLG